MFAEHCFRIHPGRFAMSVAKIIEISSTSKKGFEDAIEKGIARASKTIKNVAGAWVKEQSVDIKNGKVTGYRVHLMVTFILEDSDSDN
jgi:flavin-binding protein dodecin